MLIEEEIIFNGSGYLGKDKTYIDTRDYYSKFGWSSPQEGLSFLELSRLMKADSFKDLLRSKFNLEEESTHSIEKWGIVRDMIYIPSTSYT